MTIKEWVRENAEGLMPDQHFTDEELDHIAMCCEHLFDAVVNDRPVGSFLRAVISNNFRDACIRADGTNRKALYLYAMFMLNRTPADKLK